MYCYVHWELNLASKTVRQRESHFKNQFAFFLNLSRLFQSGENVTCRQISLKLIPWGPPSSLERERKLCGHSFTASSMKREMRHFHVVVVQRQQRKIQKSVMHVQSGCFAYPNQLLLPLPSSMLRSLISAIFQRSTFMSVHNLSQI